MKEFTKFMRKDDDTVYVLVGCLVLLVVLSAVVGFFLWLSAAANALAACRRRNRDMEPGSVWLCLVPVFGIVWSYFVAVRTAEALRREFRERELRSGGTDFGYSLGMASCICSHVGWATWWLIVGMPAIVVGVILEFSHASRLRGYTARLKRDDRRRWEEDD